MRIPKSCLSTAAVLAFSGVLAQADPSYSFAVDPAASIQFNGNAHSFLFNNDSSTGEQWSITQETGGSSALNLQGAFSGGPWSYGSVSTSGLEQSATVSSTSATLSINDSHGYVATADVAWGMIDTFQSAGGLNADLTINLSDLSYSGNNPDLQTTFSAPAGSLTLAFQFAPSMTLGQLSQGSGPYTTSFNGSVAVLPEPGTVLIAGMGIALIAGKRLFKGQKS